MARGKISDPEKEAERGRKISESRKRKFLEQGFLNTPETRAKIGEAQQGRVIPEGARAKISQALKGRRPKNLDLFLAKAHATPAKRGDEHGQWKGEEASQGVRQAWVTKTLGRPRHCEQCGTDEAKSYHWVSKSGEYHREVEDWIRLCTSCHWGNLKRDPWNKGKKTGMVPSSAFKKGEAKDNGHRFQTGLTPHNKGKKMPQISGPNNKNWKGGITEINHKIRTSVEYKVWRRAVFERDHFTCVLCGHRSKYHGRGPCDIRADHIKPFHLYVDLRFVVENGRTLCVPCDLAHGWQPWRETETVTETAMAGDAQILGLELRET